MNITAEQAKVINTQSAMNIIVKEAKEFLATKFKCRVSDVEMAYAQGNEKVVKMMAELVAKGVNECAKLIK